MTSDRRVIVVPFLGDGIDEVALGEWCVETGEAIAVDQLIARLQADDATYEIISPYAGRIGERHARAGERLQIGAWLVSFSEPDRD